MPRVPHPSLSCLGGIVRDEMLRKEMKHASRIFRTIVALSE